MSNLHIAEGRSLPDPDEPDEAAIASAFVSAIRSIGDPDLVEIVEGAEVTIRISLSAAEVQAIVGPGVFDQSERERRCTEYVTDWLSPAIRLLGEWLHRHPDQGECRVCRGQLVGSEREYGTCGQCGGRAVTP